MIIFDTHAHYDDERYKEDLDAIIQENLKQGVKKIVNVSCDLKTCKSAKEISKKYAHIYYALGIHPEGISESIDKDISAVEEMIKEGINCGKLVAIGEIGLDYHYTKENKDLQRNYFERQLELALKYDLPVIIHSRDASDDMFHILNDKKYEKLKIVFHCFQPTDSIINLVLKRNYMVGLGGNITYKRSEHSLELIRLIPLDQIMVETDAPYLAPVPVRGTRNESKNIKYVIERLAEIKNVEVNILQEILYNNSLRFFRIEKNT